MANIKSAIKRIHVTRVKTARNYALKSALRTSIRRFEEALASSDLEKAQAALRKASRHLDKAVTKGIIHKNTAARKKSRLHLKYNKVAKAV